MSWLLCIFFIYLERIPYPELDGLGARHLLVAQETEQQLQFGLFEEFTFYGTILLIPMSPLFDQEETSFQCITVFVFKLSEVMG